MIYYDDYETDIHFTRFRGKQHLGFMFQSMAEIYMSMMPTDFTNTNVEVRIAKLEIEVSQLQKENALDRKELKEFVEGASKFRKTVYDMEKGLKEESNRQHHTIMEQISSLSNDLTKATSLLERELKDKELAIYKALIGVFIAAGGLTWILTKLL